MFSAQYSVVEVQVEVQRSDFSQIFEGIYIWF